MTRAIIWLFNEMGWELFLCSLCSCAPVVVCLGVPLSLSLPTMGGLALICACTGLMWGFGPPPRLGSSRSAHPHVPTSSHGKRVCVCSQVWTGTRDYSAQSTFPSHELIQCWESRRGRWLG